ncbi:hypothetical protein [Micromonospora sp. RTP1Z1]|uniref:hypothetical protein n=1 Tax=Micromonospora sp. RTP1Z1 TaxID=2994043 RepID=UPI0039B37FB3
MGEDGALLAVSDLHVGHADNRAIVAALRPGSPRDWLLVAGDVGDTVAQVEWALDLLSRASWCVDRVATTAARLAERDPALPTVLVNHFPLVREPTRILRYPIFAQWCGTEATADWHRRCNATAAVYGHLHIPRTTWHDGVRFEEVSVGYPREWKKRPAPPGVPRRILPAPEGTPPTAW